MRIVSKSNDLSMPKVIGNRYQWKKLPLGQSLVYNDKELANIVVRGALTKFKTLYAVIDDTVDSLKAEKILEASDIKKDEVIIDISKEDYLKKIHDKFIDMDPTDTELWKATDEKAYEVFASKKEFLEAYHKLFPKVRENVHIEADVV